MKNNKYLILVVIILILISYPIYHSWGKNAMFLHKLNDEDVQVELLYNIYAEFTSNLDTNDVNIILDSSAYTDILTSKSFSTEKIERINEISSYNSDISEEFSYVLYKSYNNSNNILTIQLISKINEKKVNYKLYLKNNKVCFEQTDFSSDLSK